MSSLEPLCNFRRNPCSLEHIASVVSAAALCRRAVMMNPDNPPEKIQEIIALPPAIQKKIDRFMPFVKEQIASWNNFYDREIFLDEQRRAEEYFHVLVWSADGTINDEETAREMLKQDSLNAKEKYRIACNHFLEDEIPTLWSNLKRKINFREAKRCYPLVYYWECVCRTGKTTGLTKYIIKNVFGSSSKHTYPVCAVDYFWNILNLEERIDFLQTRYLQKMSFRNWENFLMKLSNEQLAWLFNAREAWYFDDYEHNLFCYLMRFWMHADFVVQIWMRIRDNYRDYELSYLMKTLLKCELFPFQSTEHISLALEVFNLAPYKLQKAVFDDYNQEDWWDRDSNLTDVRLDVAILSTIYPDYRQYKFWFVLWIDLFKKYPTDCFLQFMNICCEETLRGSEEFKMKVMTMDDSYADEHCYILLSEMRFSEIDHFLSLFSSDPSRIMKTKQFILRDNLLKCADWFEKTDKFIFPPPNQLIDFIEGSFENIRSANEFKIEVLSSVNYLKACFKVAGSDMFCWLKDAVSMCSCRDDDFKLYKSKFLQLGVKLAKSSEIADVFKDPGWKLFLDWCSDEN